MTDRVISIVLSGSDDLQLRPLTAVYPVALIPFGAVFRILDFSILNLLQSHLRKIYVLTRYKPETVHTYVGQSLTQHAKEFRFDLGEGPAA